MRQRGSDAAAALSTKPLSGRELAGYKNKSCATHTPALPPREIEAMEKKMVARPVADLFCSPLAADGHFLRSSTKDTMAAESSRCNDLEKFLQGQSAKPGNIPLQMLQDITNNFSEEQVLGRGGFGVVYKGELQNGRVIAVKKALLPLGNGEKQFENEVTHLMRLKHKNIVRLVGYCYDIQKILVEIEGKHVFADMPEMLLCLEFMPKGSLKDHISDECSRLDWQMRFKIIVGIFHGLHYLHENHIIHSDVKPANILLDYDMAPKITDFGVARLIGPEQTRIYTKTCVGTMGYMAPEYLNKGVISIKSDIFSAGVIIIEIITGHRNYPNGAGKDMQEFVEHVLQNWIDRLEQLRCTSLEKYCQQIKVCIEIGLNCVHNDAEKRPTTREIIECLNRWDTTNLHVSNHEKAPADQRWPRRSRPSVRYGAKVFQLSRVPKLDASRDMLMEVRGHAKGLRRQRSSRVPSIVVAQLRAVGGHPSWVALMKAKSSVSTTEVSPGNIPALRGFVAIWKRYLWRSKGNIFLPMPEMLLCLEFMPKGSLKNHISDFSGLDWQMRREIIVGICNGLHYLHDNRVIHVDLKPANILLDYDMTPKNTDFGVSRLIDPEQTRIYTKTCVGTSGYMAPEYLNKGVISIKSDIFSLGEIIIEIIVGHRNYPNGTGTSMQEFVEQVLQNWRNRLNRGVHH
ncbi:hypothetical protein ACP70R_030744 [Stipagrostis hirtigluma subsp. patula]